MSQPNPDKVLMEKIVSLTAGYADVAYGWDMLAEEDLDDYKTELLKLLGDKQ